MNGPVQFRRIRLQAKQNRGSDVVSVNCGLFRPIPTQPPPFVSAVASPITNVERLRVIRTAVSLRIADVGVPPPVPMTVGVTLVPTTSTNPLSICPP